MWSRFGLFALCCLTAVKSISQNDKIFDQIKNLRAQQTFANERNHNGSGGEHSSFARDSHSAFRNQGESNENEHRSSSNSREISLDQYGNQEPNTSKYGQNHEGSFYDRSTGESKKNFLNREKHNSTSEIIQTSNSRENSPHSIGLYENNQEHLLDRPSAGSSHSKDLRENTGTSSEFRSNPAEKNGHTSNHRVSDHHPTGFRPSNTGGSSSSRPSGESTHFTNHREVDHLTSEFRPTNEKDQFDRPTGESSNNRQTGFTDSQKQSSGHKTVQPSSQQKPGHSFTDSEPAQNQFSTGPNQQIDYSNISGPDVEETEKEEEKDICFTHLGCFKMGKPWKSILRPISAPYGPEKIQTTIHFYSRENSEKPRNITVYPQINMGEARFDPKKITVMIVHGFSNSGNATWMRDMKDVYLKKVDANVMIVDWGKGAQLLNYLQVAGNTRVVGKQLSVFVKFLIEKFGADSGKFHLIGHSLGAQICSYLGKEVSGIARLTALDPAQPGFEGFDREVRLDKTDAEFVDVVHTDARPFIPTLGFGMIAPHGHVDFYMNGGFDQPGCVPPPKKELPSIKSFLDFAKYPVEVIAKTVACPHGRAYEYLIESFNETENCIFWGHKADVKNIFKSVTNTITQGLIKKFTALSSTCSKEDCIPVGFATKKSPLRGIFVVTTNARSPYCISEPGVPPEIPPQERKQDSFIQKIGKKTGLLG